MSNILQANSIKYLNKGWRNLRYQFLKYKETNNPTTIKKRSCFNNKNASKIHLIAPEVLKLTKDERNFSNAFIARKIIEQYSNNPKCPKDRTISQFISSPSVQFLTADKHGYNSRHNQKFRSSCPIQRAEHAGDA